MVPKVDTVQGDARLPAACDVVVIGGGIIGVSAALFLGRKGLRVALCEKGTIAGEQSSRNWGWVRVSGRDRREIPLVLESQRIWEQLTEREGLNTGFKRAGIAFVFDTKRMRDVYGAWAENARDFQLTSRILSRAELQALVPGIDGRIDGALYTPSDGKAEPQKGAPAIANLAQREGAVILTGCAVRGVETTAGKVSGVVTERGPIAAPAVLLAGGAWSRHFLGNLGVDLPQLLVLGTVMRIESSAKVPETTVGGSNFAWRKRLDGGYTVAQRGATVSELTPDSFRLFRDFLPAWKAEWRDLQVRFGARFAEEWRRKRRWSLHEPTAFEATRMLDPAARPGTVETAVAGLKRAMPAFSDARVTDTWGGWMDVTPDAVPVIGPVRSLPGLFVATGFSGHGFGIGPGAGRLAADLVAGDPTIVDAAPFTLERFSRTRASIEALA
jgi:glycine/D-amino acid oxidase-like deaminating enzyme